MNNACFVCLSPFLLNSWSLFCHILLVRGKIDPWYYNTVQHHDMFLRPIPYVTRTANLQSWYAEPPWTIRFGVYRVKLGRNRDRFPIQPRIEPLQIRCSEWNWCKLQTTRLVSYKAVQPLLSLFSAFSSFFLKCPITINKWISVIKGQIQPKTWSYGSPPQFFLLFLFEVGRWQKMEK